MSAVAARLAAELNHLRTLPEPPEHVLVAADDLAALLIEVGAANARAFDAEGAARLYAALVRHVDTEARCYQLAWKSARRRAARR